VAQVRRYSRSRPTLRNEANWGRKWLSWHGGRRFGSSLSQEVLEDFEGAEEHAVGGIDAAVEAGEGVEGVLIGVAERGAVLDLGVEKFGLGEIFVEAIDLVVPELGLDAAEAALNPFGGDEGVDERELDRIGGAVVIVELRREGFEIGGIFAGDDVRPGVDAGF